MTPTTHDLRLYVLHSLNLPKISGVTLPAAEVEEIETALALDDGTLHGLLETERLRVLMEVDQIEAVFNQLGSNLGSLLRKIRSDGKDGNS